MYRKIVIEIIAFIFIVLFMYTGISKFFIEHTVFEEQIKQSPILKHFSTPIVWGLPLVEFLASVLLVIPKWRYKGLLLSFGLMTGFTIYVLSLISSSKELPCSCGGIISLLSWKDHLILNLFLLLISLVGIYLQKDSLRRQSLKKSALI